MFEKYRPTLLIPKAPTIRMRTDLYDYFGFEDIQEVSHGKDLPIGQQFEITSYQFGPAIIDSALAIKAGNRVLLNANDVKLFGNTMKQIKSRLGKIDFVFRSHSSASPVPYCVDGVNPLLTNRSPQDYSDEFINFANSLDSVYCIPFASSHIYLHRDTVKYNEFYNNPEFVRKRSDERQSQSKCVVMPPGSSWSESDGFELREHDYSKIDNDILSYSDKYKNSLNRQYIKESRAKISYQSIENYFIAFMKSLTWPLPAFRVGYLLTANMSDHDSNGTLMILDTKSRSLEYEDSWSSIECQMNSRKLMFVIRIPILVMNDCVRKRMFNCYSPSKLIRIYPGSNPNHYSTYLRLIDLYENDGLPWYRVFEPRQLFVRLSRWRELFDAILYIYKIKLLRKSVNDLWR